MTLEVDEEQVRIARGQARLGTGTLKVSGGHRSGSFRSDPYASSSRRVISRFHPTPAFARTSTPIWPRLIDRVYPRTIASRCHA